MKVLCFARLRDFVGAGEVDVSLSAHATVADLRVELRRRYPALADFLPKCAVAVNEEYADDDLVVGPGDVVALLPPVSGG